MNLERATRNTVTHTEEQPRETPKSIILRLKGFDYKAILDQLGKILTTYIGSDDDLSKQIHKWGLEVLELNLCNENDLIWLAQDRISHLFNKILVNLDGSPLKDPVFADGSVWERWMLLDFLNSCGVKDPVLETHEFAVEMLSWMKPLVTTLELDVPQATSSALVVTSFGTVTISTEAPAYLNPQAMQAFNGEDELETKRTFYVQLIQKVKRIKALQMRNIEMKNNRQLFKQSRKETEIMIAQQVERIKKQMADHEQALNDGIQVLEKNQKARVDILEKRVENEEKKVERVSEKLEKSDAKCAAQEKDIQNLNQRNAQLQQQINHNSGGGGGGGGFCSIL